MTPTLLCDILKTVLTCNRLNLGKGVSAYLDSYSSRASKSDYCHEQISMKYLQRPTGTKHKFPIVASCLIRKYVHDKMF